MKLLNDIVTLLMNENGSLNEALLKTKVLLHEIGQRELVSWVNSELSGYSDDADLPPYRTLYSQVYGTVTNGYYINYRRVIPVRHLREEFGDTFEVAKMRQPVSVYEKSVAGSTPQSAMTKQLGPQIDLLLSKQYEDGYYVESSYSFIGIAQIRQILIEVRSRLLDFILELRAEVGATASEDDVKERADTLDVPGMFGKAVFGDNVTIVIGNQNQSHITNTSSRNDAAALAAELRKHGVSEHDIEVLDAAIVDDPTPATAGQYGPAVRGWMTRMLGKAVDGSWNVGVSAAGTLLASVLARYYGLPS